jgi:hypothetical protein
MPELANELVTACMEGSSTWVSLAMAAELSTMLSQITAAHLANQPAMAVFLPARDAGLYAASLWELDPDLHLVLCGTAEELQHTDLSIMTGPWHTLREPWLPLELRALAQSLRAEYHSQQRLQQRIDTLQELVAERTAALSDSHMHFAMQFHESALPQALFRYEDGTCVDTNAAFTALTGHETDAWRDGPLRLLTQTGLLPALAGPHPRRGVSVSLQSTQQRHSALVFTQMVWFGPEPCLLVCASASMTATPTEPALHMAMRA